jgi:hypothetical protein
MKILSAKFTAVAMVWRPLIDDEAVFVRAGYEAGVAVNSSEPDVPVVAMLIVCRVFGGYGR